MNRFTCAAVAITATAFATTAPAGNLVFEAPVEQAVIVEDEPMGGSSAWWIVPLIAAIAIGVAVSDDDDDEGTGQDDPVVLSTGR